jgi:hypothetical protein
LGNFIGTVGAAPVALQATPLSITQAAPGERAWIGSASDNWDDMDNWYYWGRADTHYEVANFGSAIAADTFITLDTPVTVKGLRLRNPHRYSVNGTGSIDLTADTGRALIDTRQGDHNLLVPVALNSDTDADTQGAAVLRFKAALDLNGHELNVTGLGRIWIHDVFTMDGGTLVLDGLAPFSFASTSTPTLDGYLEFRPVPGADLSLGASFDLFNGIAYALDPFDGITMPELAGGLAWDLSSLMVNGIVTVISGLAGDLDGDGFVGITDLNLVLGNWNQNVTQGDWSLGDPSGDGFVGIEDLNAVLGNWNAGTPPSDRTNIPEPTTITLLSLACCGALRRI